MRGTKVARSSQTLCTYNVHPLCGVDGAIRDNPCLVCLQMVLSRRTHPGQKDVNSWTDSGWRSRMQIRYQRSARGSRTVACRRSPDSCFSGCRRFCLRFITLCSLCLMSYFKYVKSGTLMPGCPCRKSCVQMLDCRAAGLHLLPCQQIMVLDQLDWSSHSSVMVLWTHRILSVFYFL